MGLLGKLSHITLLGVVTMAIAVVAAAQALPNCDDSCGNIPIPYPFGMEEGCYLDKSFMVSCIRQKPKLGNISVEGIWLESHELRASQTVARDCYKNRSGKPVREKNENSSIPEAPQFTISGKKNKFTVLGCDTFGFLDGFHQGKQYQIGCSTRCPSLSNVVNGSCSGVGCCQVDIPDGWTNVSVSVNSFNSHSQVLEFNPCGYAFAVNKDKFNFSISYLNPPGETVRVFPVVLQWAVGNETCQAAENKRTYLCQGNRTYCQNATGASGYRCLCKQGYRGNPYLIEGGCKDIDECIENLHNCTKDEKCHNLEGSFKCRCRDWFKTKRKKGPGCDPSPGFTTAISIVTTVSFAATLRVSFRLYLGHEKRNRQKFFYQNGGSDLQGQAKMFTVEELKKATKNFHKSGIIRHGGFGSFYRGNLANIGEVAIKKSEKSKAVNQSPKKQFIEEVVALSHIKHKNIVKLLGCCLETEIPLIVYEFIPNGTLSEYIHNGSKPSPINNMGNPPNEGLNIRNPPEEGLDIRDPPKEGLEMGNPPKEGLDTRNPLEEGLDMGNPPKEGLDTRNPLEEGLDMGNPPKEGLDTRNPLEEGLDMGNPPKEGLDTRNPLEEGLEMGNPHEEGLDMGNPLEKGLNTRNPPKEGFNMGNPPEGGLNIRDPPKEGLEMGNPPEEGLNMGNPLEEGLDIKDPLKEGLEMGSPPKEGLEIGSPPEERLEMGNPPEEGLNTRNLPKKGLDIGDPPKERLEIGNPPEERFEIGNPPEERFDTRNPLEEGLDMGNPPEEGFNIENPLEEGLNMGNPPKDGFDIENPEAEEGSNMENQPEMGLWKTRVKIAAEVAKALQKLHSETPKPLIHRNVKSANILLDENITTKVITAKVSDFGISGLFSQDQKELVQETLGYLDPEYLQTNELTEKSDIYSFGVVLVELLTGKEAFLKDNSEDKSLAGYFLFHKEQNQLFKVLDKGIVEEGNEEQIEVVSELAEGCLKLKGNERPRMEYVAMKLESIRKTNIDPLDDPQSTEPELEESIDPELEQPEMDATYENE